MRQVVAALKQLPDAATDIQSPFTSAGLVNGRSALVTFNVAGKPGNDDTAVVPALNAVAAIQARHPGLTVAEAGGASVDRMASAEIGQDFRTAAVTSLPVTLVLLLIVFGALIAAGIPLLLAGTAVIAAISLLSIPSRIVPIDGTTSAIVLLVGMAVGIDYSLFYLRRVREERAAGRDTKEALHVAAATSGRAIAVSGLTVMISLAGLFLTGIDVFSGVAIGTILVVGVSVLGSLTFLPALLSLLGTATDRARIPFLGRRRAAARPSRLWGLVVRAVVRHPLALGGLAAIALLALATPLLSLHLENPDLHAFPNSVPVIRTEEAIGQAFPGGPEPAEVVVTGDNLSGAGVSHAITALHAQVAATHGAIREPITTAAVRGGPARKRPGAGHLGPAERQRHQRDQSSTRSTRSTPGCCPPRWARCRGSATWSAVTPPATPTSTRSWTAGRRWCFAFVLGLAFLLLMVSFRSVAIPALSIALNLLSVGAAYGVMTWIFQDGHLQGLLGFSSYGGITPWLPLFMFVLLFGLSMDYHVFILSRIRELRLRGASAKTAVTDGITSSAGVVTSAAVIMVAVFSIFASLSEIEFKVFGVAMAVAVLIDATVVRGVLLPAGLALLGDRAWAMPGRPRVRGRTGPPEVEPGSVRENLNLTLDEIGRRLG